MALALKSVGTMSGAARAVKAEVAGALVRPLKGQASARSPLIRPLLCCTSRWICDTELWTPFEVLSSLDCLFLTRSTLRAQV